MKKTLSSLLFALILAGPLQANTVDSNIQNNVSQESNIDLLLKEFKKSVYKYIKELKSQDYKNLNASKKQIEKIKSAIEKESKTLEGADVIKIKSTFENCQKDILKAEETAFNVDIAKLPKFRDPEVNAYVIKYEEHVLSLAKSFYAKNITNAKNTRKQTYQFVKGLELISQRLLPNEFSKMGDYVNAKNKQVKLITKIK